jgi:hypothetical protein
VIPAKQHGRIVILKADKEVKTARDIYAKAVDLFKSAIFWINQNLFGNLFNLGFMNRAMPELWIYVLDSGPGMPVGDVLTGEYRAATTDEGKAFQFLKKGKVGENGQLLSPDWFVASRGQKWDQSAQSLKNAVTPSEKGVMFGLHVPSNLARSESRTEDEGESPELRKGPGNKKQITFHSYQGLDQSCAYAIIYI